MKDLFPEFYNLEPDEIEDLWKECIFVFDANVLLNLYRYSLETSNNLLEILNSFSERIWIPHQFALEYQRNRMPVIEEQKIKYDKSVNTVLGELDTVETLLKNYFATLPFDIDKIKQELTKSQETYPDCNSEDKTRRELDLLFAEKVGNPFDKEKLTAIYKDGQDRYQKEIPPGYGDAKDKDKDDPAQVRKFGDLVGWLQIIEKAKESHKSIIFITSERKDDWWQKVKGKIVGPRHELISEFRNGSGKLFYMYDMERFLSYAKESLHVNEATIDEVKKVEEVYNELPISEKDIINSDSILESQVAAKETTAGWQEVDIVDSGVDHGGPVVADSENGIEEVATV